jgi:hypothetical protein
MYIYMYSFTYLEQLFHAWNKGAVAEMVCSVKYVILINI